MYVTSRILRVSNGGAQAQAIGLVNYVLNHLNTEHGTDFGAGVMVGGDPGVIGITGRFESLSDYQRTQEAMRADTEFQSAVALGSHLFADAQDTLWQVRMAPGEADRFSTVSEVNANLQQPAEAMTFAAEIASTVGEIIDSQIGVVTAATGDRTRLLFVGFSASLAEVEANNEKLESSEAYLDLFKRAEGPFIAGHLTQNLWVRVTE